MLSPRLVNTISAHSWSPDETTLALCPNSSEIIVYRDLGNGSLTKQCRLREHSQLVSDIHWSREGSFASCSHDGSAYVWTRTGDAWKPELVFTRLRLAALCLKWNPSGSCFAIGSSERLICICHRDKRNNCWAARLIRKCHSSSVTTVAWSPCGAFLAATSTDGRCMLFSAGSSGASQGGGSAFGAVLMDIQAGCGWGLGLSWSPSGGQLAISSHGCAVHFVSGLLEGLAGGGAAEEQPQQQLLRLEQLPLRCVQHLSETKLVGAGFDGEVYLFEKMPGGEWAQSGALAPTAALSEASGQPGKLSAAFKDKLALFKGYDSHAGSPRGVREAVREQRQAPHSNVVVDMHVFKAPDGTPTGKFTTGGWDGRVLMWQVDLTETIKAMH